jgi:hypothetical protein
MLTDLLSRKSVLLADGATGTNLFEMGLMSGDPPEMWNLDHPERVRALHQGFVDAGADIILTNSFGGNARRLALHKLDGRVRELNAAAARNARDVADGAGRPVVGLAPSGPPGTCSRRWGPSSRRRPSTSSPSRSKGCARAVPTSSGSRPCRRRKKCGPPPRPPPASACPIP